MNDECRWISTFVCRIEDVAEILDSFVRECSMCRYYDENGGLQYNAHVD